MGSQIIKQTLVDGKTHEIDGHECAPGKYAVFSSVVDDFTCINADREELIEFFMEKERTRIERMVDQVVDDSRIKTQFTKSFEDAVAWARTVHEDDED